MTKLYVIGDKKTGVLFVKTNPLRSVLIPAIAIKAHAKTEKVTYEEAFGRIGSMAKFLTNKSSKTPKYPDNSPMFQAVGDLIAGGETLTDADFCFVSELAEDASKGFSAKRFSSARFSSARFSTAPVADALAKLDGDSEPSEAIAVAGFGSKPRKATVRKAVKTVAKKTVVAKAAVRKAS